ncbi:hypothetical protein AWB82_03058 [Caballeronia glebae]|uniref:DUF4239 domain-containing protein n=1 Tax=Caballeronia glebae TaxID=1777143 RepID=A0A158AVP6_9BURK|nr:hypothetical protein AWB82_03058 [Caballeronia glebae]
MRQREGGRERVVAEQAFAASQHHGVDQQAKLVDEAGREQLTHGFAASESQQIRAFITFERAHRVGEFARQGAVTLKISPPTLNEALQFTLALPANTAGQQTAQRQLTVSLEQALEARRERILVSRSEVSGIKWLCLSFLAVCLVFAIALVHGENRLTSALALGLFCASLATTMLLILSHDRPFSGEIAVKPEPLLQVIPAAR